MNLAARIISIVFHPLLMVTYLLSVFALNFPMGLDPLREENHKNLILLIFSITFLLPVTAIGILKSIGLVESFQMSDRRDRLLPFVIICVLYGGTTFMFYSRYQINFHDNLLKFLVVADVLVLLATFITIYYKVSIHSLAAWGMVGILLPLNKLVEDGSLFYPTIISLIVAGLIMSARLQLNAHSPREVFTGAVVGIAASFTTMTILF